VRTGFALRELRLTGSGVTDAVVTFTDGLNVVVGPSDTGKTYVAQCLSFVVGTGKTPKAIPEAAPYDTARVLLTARVDGVEHTLARRLDGSGTVEHTRGGEPAPPLGAHHDPKRSETLPAFLLGLSGLSDRVVRMRVSGHARPLAFSDVARLFVVDEESVISERSPIHSGQYNHTMVEARVFRLLLTGSDDAGVVAVVKPEVARGRRAGRTEVLEELSAAIRVDLDRLNVKGSAEEAERRAEEWATRAEAAADELDGAQRAAEPVEQRRRMVLGELRRTRSQIEHRSELQTRFALLTAQYESDLDRLALVEQAGARLEQLSEERCPVCGAAAEHQQHDHRRGHVGAGEIADSCRAEADKIARLARDLDATIAANGAELSRLGTQEAGQAVAMSQIEHELSSVLNPQVGKAALA
jgi:hypothetical protein